MILVRNCIAKDEILKSRSAKEHLTHAFLICLLYASWFTHPTQSTQPIPFLLSRRQNSTLDFNTASKKFVT